MKDAWQVLQQWRERLAPLQGDAYWRALEDAGEDATLRRAAQACLPELAGLWGRRIDRRQLLQLLGASLMFAGASACSRPREKLVPYTAMPEGLVPGVPQLWATALSRGGYAHGVVVKTHMGRPIKVEGNPLHPASRGGTDVFSQAAAAMLFDPERSRAPQQRGNVVPDEAVLEAFSRARRRWLGRDGEGLAILTGAVSSPTLRRQFDALRRQLPAARWYQHEPVDRSQALEGAALAFGRAAEPVYAFAGARAVVALDAEFLGAMPGHLRYARDFSGARRADGPGGAIRLYAAESTPTTVGAKADHVLRIAPLRIGTIARRLAAAVGVSDVDAPRASGLEERWIRLAAADLLAYRGAALVVCGDGQPAAVHAIAHAINHRLDNFGKTVRLIEPVCDARASDGGLEDLCGLMAGGAVDALVMLETNPAYTSPADLTFMESLRRVRFTLHSGTYHDESAAASEWHVPAPHPFEAWSDARAYDGTAAIQQPLIEPLYPSRGPHEWLALMLDGDAGDARAHVQETWRAHMGTTGFDERWHRALADGIVAGSQSASLAVAPRQDWHDRIGPPHEDRLQLQFVADSSVWDGRYANSAWLQELPRPLSSLTWGNALLMSRELAAGLGVANGDHVEVTHAGQALTAPAWILHGHPQRCATLALGYGRSRAGGIGSAVGVNAYRLRTRAARWIAAGVRMRAVAGHTPLASIQHHHDMQGRELARRLDVDALAAGASARQPGGPPPTLYGNPERRGRYAWGMTIDLNACIGCGVCTIACQAENNIPAVGKDEVRAGREMHWIRVDADRAGPDGEGTVFQPVPCMHCELAPCEYVCPVEASIHDSEGLNLQVYNRCIGTRDCSQNCPYKVRRFNWLDYNGYEHRAPLATPAAALNPDVTVRSRGVMEKCTYCVQRISRARIQSKLEDRSIREGEVEPACAAACPAQAIVFGDLQRADSEVNRWRASPRHYVLLEELGTRPRTTYLAALANPSPRAEDDEGDAA